VKARKGDIVQYIRHHDKPHKLYQKVGVVVGTWVGGVDVLIDGEIEQLSSRSLKVLNESR
jgi:hypothetical protein